MLIIIIYSIFGTRIAQLIKSLENRPVMCLMLSLTYYAQNYAGIIGANLDSSCNGRFIGI